MAVRIRLRQQGKKNQQTYRLVATDARAPRDGKYLELLGWYNPFQIGTNASIDEPRIAHWLGKGAQMSEQARAIIAQCAPHIVKGWQANLLARRAREASRRRASKKA